MFCTPLLFELENKAEYQSLLLLRTIEFTIYLKTSKIKHQNEILALNLISNPSNYDTKNFLDIYLNPNEFYITKNDVYDSLMGQKTNWNYNDDEQNYPKSLIICALLEKLNNFIANINIRNDFSFVYVDLNNNKTAFYPLVISPNLVSKEFNIKMKQYMIQKQDDKLHKLFLNYQNITRFDENDSTLKKSILNYMQTKISLNIEKIIYIIKKRTEDDL